MLVRSVIVGLTRRWKTGLTQAFGVAGAIWLVTEITTKVSQTADKWLAQHGNLYIETVLITSAVWFFYYSYEARSVSFLIPTTDSEINIKFGDLFLEQSDWIIGANEFFDSALGHVVAINSLHGQFISKVFSGDEPRFRGALDAALAGKPFDETSRTIQPAKRYPIGTTAVLQNGSHKVYLVAISRTDLITAKASSTVSMLWDALIGGLQTVHESGNGSMISLPLIGNGRSSVNVAPQHLLRLVVLALVDFGRKKGLPKQINIVLSDDCFEHLDLREIKRDWKKS